MISKQLIDKFYEDVERLDIKFKAAVITEKTGYSKGNVSDFLNKKKEPSEKFIKAFYTAFPEVPKLFHEEHPDTRKLITALEHHNDILEKVIQSNLTALMQLLSAIHRHDLAYHRTMLRSLARVEKRKDKDALIEEADILEGEFLLEEKKRGNLQKVGK